MKLTKKTIIGRVNVIETKFSGSKVTHENCPIILAQYESEDGIYGVERCSELAVWIRESKFSNNQFYPSQIGVTLGRTLYAQAVATGTIEADGVDVIGMSAEGAEEKLTILTL